MRLINLETTCSQMKWQSMPMCFDLAWAIGLLASWMVNWLLQKTHGNSSNGLKTSHKLFQPQQFWCNRDQGTMFCLSWRPKYSGLVLEAPVDKWVTNENTEAGGGTMPNLGFNNSCLIALFCTSVIIYDTKLSTCTRFRKRCFICIYRFLIKKICIYR